eukprot:scaffold11075_cov132-Isochrysis_galbana.AAC.1
MSPGTSPDAKVLPVSRDTSFSFDIYLVARGQAADHRQQRAHVHHLPRLGYGLPHATPHGVQVTIPSNVRALPRRERWGSVSSPGLPSILPRPGLMHWAGGAF